MKVFAVALVAVLALAGFAFAFSGGRLALPGIGWHQGRPDFNGTVNATMPFGRHGFNGTLNGTMPRGMPGFNGTAPCNMTGFLQNVSAEREQFKTAVENGDYVSAKALNEQYGFGGRVVGLLNETTFPKYSQIFKLRDELMGELGIDGTPAATHRGCATGDRPGFARGNHHRPWEGANGTGALPTPSG